MKRETSAIAFILLLVFGLGSASYSNAVCTPKIDEVSPSGVFVGQEFAIRGSCLIDQADVQWPSVFLDELPLRVSSATPEEVVATVTRPTSADTLTLRSGSGQTTTQTIVNNWTEPRQDEIRAGYIEVQLSPETMIASPLARLGGSQPEQVFGRWLSRFPELAGWWRLQVDGDATAAARQWATQEGVLWAQPDIVGISGLNSR